MDRVDECIQKCEEGIEICNQLLKKIIEQENKLIELKVINNHIRELRGEKQ